MVLREVSYAFVIGMPHASVMSLMSSSMHGSALDVSVQMSGTRLRSDKSCSISSDVTVHDVVALISSSSLSPSGEYVVFAEGMCSLGKEDDGCAIRVTSCNWNIVLQGK